MRRTEWISTIGKPEWAQSNVAAYRIWMKHDGRNWWQRHEWRYRDGAPDWCEDWIMAPNIPPHAGFKPV